MPCGTTSLSHGIVRRADWLRTFYEQIHTEVMAGGYVQIDAPLTGYQPQQRPSQAWLRIACKRLCADVFFSLLSRGHVGSCLDHIPAALTEPHSATVISITLSLPSAVMNASLGACPVRVLRSQAHVPKLLTVAAAQPLTLPHP